MIAIGSQPIGSSGNRCNVSPSYAATSQLIVTPSIAFFRRAISRPLMPACPPFNWISLTSSRSAFLRPSRNAMGSIMPVHGAPVSPSKNATRQPCSLQYSCNAALLAASAARARAQALIRFFVCTALLAAERHFRVNAAFSPADIV